MDPHIIYIIIWAAIFIVALITELLTDQLVSIWFSVGALFALIFAAISQIPEWVSIIVFVVVSAAALTLFIVFFREKFLKQSEYKTNTQSYIGQKMRLLEDTKDTFGKVKINDTIWTVDCDEDYPANTLVKITDIKGNHLIAKKIAEKVTEGETK